MKKTSFLALLLAILMPLCGYYIVKFYSKNAVHIPKHYFPDRVDQIEKGGKTTTDTVWHKIKSIPFTNQLGQRVSFDSLKGKIIVLDFFFTSCPSICPGLARNMKKLQDSFIKNDSIVQFISVSVDPERDSVPRLRKFADHYNANHDTWWFVTGNKQQIYDFGNKEIRANIYDPGVDTAFIHTENFFLIDTNRVLRGFYNGFDTVALSQLARDIPTLMLERDKKSPSILRSFIPILPLIFIGIGMVVVLIVLLNRKANNKFS
jgi:protein SCO1